MAAMEQKIGVDGLDPRQRAIVMERVKENLVNSIERGELPGLKLRQQVETRRDRANQRELPR